MCEYDSHNQELVVSAYGNVLRQGVIKEYKVS